MDGRAINEYGVVKIDADWLGMGKIRAKGNLLSALALGRTLPMARCRAIW